MSATTNFVTFNPGIDNAESDSTYQADSTVTGGLVSAMASPQMHNKLFHQCSIMVKALANMMVAQGQSALDTSESALTADLIATIESMVVSNGISSPAYWL